LKYVWLVERLAIGNLTVLWGTWN